MHPVSSPRGGGGTCSVHDGGIRVEGASYGKLKTFKT